MGNSKIVFNAKVLIDLTGDTVAAANLLEGATTHGKDGELVTGKMLDRNTVGKHGAVGASSSFPSVAVTPVERDTQAWQNTDGVKRLYLKPPAGFYNGESYVGDSYASVASAIGLTADKIIQGNTVLGIAGSGRLAQNVGIWAVIGGYDHEGNIRVGGFTYSTDWVTLSHTGSIEVHRNNVTLTATLKKTGYWRIDNWSIGENYGNWTYPTGGTYRYDAGTVIKLQLNWNDVEVCCGCTIIQYQGQ